MSTLLIVILVLLVLGGGGGYYGYGRYGGAGLGGVLGVVVIILLVLFLAGGLHAEERDQFALRLVRPTGNAAADISAALKQPAAPASTTAGGSLIAGLTQIVQDAITFFSGDFDSAIQLSTQFPQIMDYNGKACWTQASSIAALLTAHPLVVSGHAVTDAEALRLFLASINQMCSNPACTQVFSDLANGIAQAGAGLSIPSLSQLCGKVPTITLGTASILPAPLPTPVTTSTPVPMPTLVAPTPSPTPTP